MKQKFTKIYLLIFTLLTLSCNNDDDDNDNQVADPTLKEQITGKWKVIYEKDGGFISDFGFCDNGQDEIEFKADNTFNDIGFISYLNDCIEDGNEFGSWSTNNNTLILKYDETLGYEDENWMIITITETQLNITELSIEGEKVERTLKKI
tara:strand:- start:853 stop:1302 length:450 start_codon:yes stop_codon:yes gene_type:complete